MSLAAVSKYVEELRKQPADTFLSELVEVQGTTSLTKIVGVLRERGVYEVFLPEGKRTGMISARDILKITNIEGPKPTAVMAYVPILRNDSLIGEVARLMADYRIRAVPISDGHKFVGQVDSLTILRSLKGKIGGEMRISSIATKDPTTINKDAPLAKARDLMVRKRIDHLPITKDQRLDGIIRSIDLVGHMAPERVGSKSMRSETRPSFDIAVGDLMDKNPLTCSAETTAEHALDQMLSGSASYILVTQWEELQGIATHRDFMTLVAESEPEGDVPVFIVGLPDDPFEAEATKAKFKRTINQLSRVFPDIVEARSVIKTKFTKPGKERGRYEVKVQIRTTRNSYTYSEGGWELPAVYDVITDRLKRLLTQKQKPRRSREREAREPL